MKHGQTNKQTNNKPHAEKADLFVYCRMHCFLSGIRFLGVVTTQGVTYCQEQVQILHRLLFASLAESAPIR